jgi:hypothetical protein
VFHVQRSRLKHRTRCGLDAQRVPSISGDVARDPFFWRPAAAFLKLLPGVEPAVCVLCAAIVPISSER